MAHLARPRERNWPPSGDIAGERRHGDCGQDRQHRDENAGDSAEGVAGLIQSGNGGIAALLSAPAIVAAPMNGRNRATGFAAPPRICTMASAEMNTAMTAASGCG